MARELTWYLNSVKVWYFLWEAHDGILSDACVKIDSIFQAKELKVFHIKITSGSLQRSIATRQKMLIRQRLLLARKFTDVILIIDQSKVGYWWGFVRVQQKSRSIRILGVIHFWTEERQTRSHSIWVQRTGEIMQFPLVSNLQSSPCTLLLLHQNQLILQHSRTNWQQWLLKALKIISPAIYFLACTCFNQSISWYSLRIHW